MGRLLKILLIDDSPDDADLAILQLKKGGWEIKPLRVASRDALRAALKERSWDVILSGFSLPGFSGEEALRLVRENGLDTPFIIVSSTIGEEAAVAMMRDGAQDYVMKDRLGRLVPAVERELQEAENRREQKAQHEALIESEEKFSKIFRQAPLLITLSDIETGRLYEVNEKYLEISGFSRDEVIGRTVVEIGWISQEQRAVMLRLLHGQGRVENLELALRSKDGRNIICSYNGELITVKGRQCLLSIAQDITQRKKVEEALRKAEALYHELVETAQDLIWQCDAEGKYTYLNPAWETVLGYSVEEMLGKKFTCFQDLDTARKDMEIFGRLLQGEMVNAYETTHRSKNGNNVHLVFNARFVRDEQGNILGTRGTAYDISERKRAEEALRESQRFLQTVMDGVSEPIMVIGMDYRVLLMNNAARRNSGTGALCHEVSHHSGMPCSGKGEDCPLEEVRSTGKPVSVVHEHIDNAGRIRFIEILASPYYDADGKLLGIIESSRDITERKRAEDEKLRLERQVQHAQKLESLGVLAGGIAHDFNNILMGILGNTALALMRMQDDSPERESLLEIEKAARRAADLSMQMLAYSGKGKFLIEPIDLNKLVGEMARLLEVSISKKAALRYDFNEHLPLFEGDATQVRQIVMNLITNASEALGEAGGSVTLSTGVTVCDRSYIDSTNEVLLASYDAPLPEGRYVFLDVSDTGCGMDADTRRKIFDPFFTTKFTGRGLGMAAVLGILRGHRGAIRIYSEVGKGTTIRVLFPAGEGFAVKQAAEGKGAQDEWRGAGTVLLVDDDKTVCDVGSELLKHLGFTVLTAPDGRKALEVFRSHAETITVVLLDLTMPQMGGEEVFSELRRLRPDVKVVLCSGFTEQDATTRMSDKGLAGFLQKPYDIDRLSQVLKQVLGEEKVFPSR